MTGEDTKRELINFELLGSQMRMSREDEKIIRADERRKVLDETLKIIGKELTSLEERLRIETNEGRWIGEEKCLFAIERLEHLEEQIEGGEKNEKK